jgi:hypothetical protein
MHNEIAYFWLTDLVNDLKLCTQVIGLDIHVHLVIQKSFRSRHIKKSQWSPFKLVSSILPMGYILEQKKRISSF